MAFSAADFWAAFWTGLAVATAAAVVAGVISLIRFIRRTDAHRIEQLGRAAATAEKVEHQQNHLIRWARAVGQKVGIPFSNGDDDWEP